MERPAELRVTAPRGLAGWWQRTFARNLARAHVSATSARLGARLSVEWRVEPTDDTTLVTVSIVGAEVARKRLSARTGISVVTERSEFFVVELGRHDVSPRGATVSGVASHDIPAGLVPSFAAKLNEIAWAVVVDVTRAAGETQRLEFPLMMQPQVKR